MTKEQWRKREAQWKQFHAWEAEQTRRLRLTPREAFRIFDILYKEARARGLLKRRALLDGHLKAAIRMAAILNGECGETPRLSWKV